MSDDGSYIHWPSRDVHLSLDAIRSVLDPAFAERSAASRITRSRNWGLAVATYRKQRGLRQADVQGLSERQVRRIENGEHTSVTALKTLAAAHGMELRAYLDAVAQAM